MTPDVEQPPAGRADRLRSCIGWLMMLAVLVHPTQASINLLAASGSRQLNLCVVDIVLACAFGLWLLRRLIRRDFSRPPICGAALMAVVWLCLSLVPQLKGSAGGDIEVSRLGVAKVVQFVEFFVVGYILFAETFQDSRRRRRAIGLFFCIASLAVIIALAQYASAATAVLHVRGSWFDNRNTFGAFLAMALPLLWGVGIFSRSRPAVAAAAVLVLAGLCVSLSGGAFLAICAGVLFVAALRGRTAFVATAVALVLLVGVGLSRLPRRNSEVLLDSVALYKQEDPYRVFGNKIAKIQARNRAKWSQGDHLTETDHSWKWQQRYKEWQAALNMMAAAPLFGVGAGSYQKNVGPFYLGLPKINEDLMEPDTLSGYMVWGASAGVPFLIILAAMFLNAVIAAGRAFAVCAEAKTRGLAAGILGSLVAVAVVTVFTNPFVRGVGVTLALVVALAQSARNNVPCCSASGKDTQE